MPKQRLRKNPKLRRSSRHEHKYRRYENENRWLRNKIKRMRKTLRKQPNNRELKARLIRSS